MLFTIIADDLTGSNDSGVQFAKKGLTSSVFFNIDEINISNNGTDVIIIDTDSRAISKEEAYTKVFEAANFIKRYPYKYLYKKIDSTLRGNIGAEIDAILDVFQKDFAIIAPAYPAIGRKTINGNHYLHEKLIHLTEIAKDPITPVLESNIEKILQMQTKRKTGTIKLDDIKKGKEHIHLLLKEFKENRIELVVIDSEKEDDLSNIVKYIFLTGYDVLWAGSAGLAEHIVKTGDIKDIKNNDFKIPHNQEPVIIIAGSLSQATKFQIEYMRGKDNISHIELNPVDLFDRRKGKQEIKRCKDLLIDELKKRKDIVLYSGTRAEQISEAIRKGEIFGLNKIEVSNKIAETLGEIVGDIIKDVKISGLVLTGGDTAKAVSRQIGVTGMKLISELEAGIPIGYFIGPYETAVITKAGAFGTKEALFKARNFLKGGLVNG